MTKLWQMMQIRDTKNLKLDKEDIMSKVKTDRMERVDQDKGILETGGRCRSVVSGAVCSSARWMA